MTEFNLVDCYNCHTAMSIYRCNRCNICDNRICDQCCIGTGVTLAGPHINCEMFCNNNECIIKHLSSCHSVKDPLICGLLDKIKKLEEQLK